MVHREEFNKLDPVDQLGLVNNYLAEGLSLLDIFQKKDKKINLSESTFRSRAKKWGYVLDKKTNQYVLNNCVHKSNIKKHPNKDYKAIQKVSNAKEKVQADSDSIVPKSINKVYFQKKEKDIVELLSLKTDIKEMLDWFKREKNIIDIKTDELRIDENVIETEIVAKTFRVYKSVLKDFLDFAKENKQFKQQDLISMALKEFLEHYSDGRR